MKFCTCQVNLHKINQEGVRKVIGLCLKKMKEEEETTIFLINNTNLQIYLKPTMI